MILTIVDAANIAPSTTLNYPAVKPGILWQPYTSSTPFRQPSFIIGRAPPGPSSAG